MPDDQPMSDEVRALLAHAWDDGRAWGWRDCDLAGRTVNWTPDDEARNPWRGDAPSEPAPDLEGAGEGPNGTRTAWVTEWARTTRTHWGKRRGLSAPLVAGANRDRWRDRGYLILRRQVTQWEVDE